MSRYPSEDVARFDQQFAEDEEEKRARWRATRQKCKLCGGSGHVCAEFGVSGICCPDCRGTGNAPRVISQPSNG